MAKPFGRGANRLTQYIRMRGALLPSQLDEHRAGQVREEQCVFCFNPHTYIPLFHYPLGGGETPERVPGIFVCDDCDNIIEAKLRSGTNTKTIGLFNDIQTFVSQGVFPDHTYEHYQHLNEEIEPNAKEKKLSCIFCKMPQRINVSDPYTKEFCQEIDTPMGATQNWLDGGKVLICLSCVKLIEDELKQFRIGTIEDYIETFTEVAICPVCDGNYLITKFEDEVRAQNGTLFKHMCGACTYELLTSDSRKLHYAGHDMRQLYKARTDNFEANTAVVRHKEEICESCGQYILVDLTLIPEYVAAQYFDTSSNYICECCSKHGGGYPPLVMKLEAHTLRFYKDDTGKFTLVYWSTGDSRILSVRENVSPEVAKQELFALLPSTTLLDENSDI